MKTKQDILNWIEENRQPFIDLSDKIWENPELANREFISSKLQADFLEGQGFKITWDLGGLNTAFLAEWGEGKPVIGFAGEYDALGGLSQKAQTAQEPLIPGAAGHACGHNLLGVGCLLAAVAAKQYLEANHQGGTVRYYGCPAEEAGDGKVYMARAGVFNDLDAAFNYHPDYLNFASKGSAVAVTDIKFRFHGRSAHAGGSPHLGRSALDAVELMNVGVNYLREHVTSNVRMHYVITNGGDAPNIVPPEAEVWYFLRAPLREELNQVTERVKRIARGAAIMTGTEVEIIFQGACSHLLNNHVLADLQYENMKVIGPIPFTEADYEQARQINEGYPPEIRDNNLIAGMPPAGKAIAEALKGISLAAENYPSFDIDYIATGSTDVGDLSLVTPLSMLGTACWPTGAPGHTWGITAAGRLPMGHKGMLHAARIMALSAIDCFNDPEILIKARQEFEKAMQGKPYICPIPDEVQPHIYPRP